MKNFIHKHAILCLISAAVLLTVSCKRKHSCYSKELEESVKDSFCPGYAGSYEGCDGKFYPNECEAAKAGIRLK